MVISQDDMYQSEEINIFQADINQSKNESVTASPNPVKKEPMINDKKMD